jgi:hypothetical protein
MGGEHHELYSSLLRDVYIMEHEVVPCSSKICGWPLKLSHDHFGLHQEGNVRATMKLEVPKRPIFRPTLSAIMVQWILQWERQKRFSHCKCQGTMHMAEKLPF